MTAGLSAARWQKPPHGVTKINVDAHILAGQYVSVGVVVRDATGSVQMMATKRIVCGEDSTMAEAEAARYGLLVARRADYDKVWLESDALAVVQAIHKDDDGCSPIWLIYSDIKMMLLSFSSSHFSHVKRTGNTVAHLVARWDTHGVSELICMAPIPQSIITLAEYDLQ